MARWRPHLRASARRCAIGERRSAMTRREFLDALLVTLALQDVTHENPRRDDVIRIDFARFDQLLHFGNRHSRGGGHHRVEVARRAAIDQIPGGVAAPGLYEREI